MTLCHQCRKFEGNLAEASVDGASRSCGGGGGGVFFRGGGIQPRQLPRLPQCNFNAVVTEDLNLTSKT